jgi:lipopolysaccharide transport system permease protein
VGINLAAPSNTMPLLSVARATRYESLAGLLWTLVRTDFKTRYHGTLQGFFWALLKPLAMFLVLMSVFSYIFQSDPHYRLNLIIGLFLWDFFSDATRTTMGSLQAKSYLLTKARLPAWIFVVSSTSNALVTLTAFTIILSGYLLMSGGVPHPLHIVLFAVYLVHYVLIVIGIGLATSVLFLRFRDLNQVWDVMLQAGFFIAPIIYPLAIIPEDIHAYLYLWPPTPIIQFSRQVLADGMIPSLRAHVFLALGTGVIFVTGLLIFKARSKRVAEYL